MTADSELERRRRLTFQQADGLEPLPAQLRTGQISKEMRARLYRVIYESIKASERFHHSRTRLGTSWDRVLSDWWVEVAHKYADAFDDRVSVWTELLRNLVDETSYADVLGFFQYVLRHRARPAGFAVKLEAALTASRSAYRVVGGDTIMPIGSEGEAAALNRAFSDLDDTRMKGARAHLAEAGLALTQGHWSDSVRESMQAVESVVRRLSQTNSVNDALKRLASKGHINPNMSAGLG